MLDLDHRLWPLLASLSKAGADWLAQEIIDGLRSSDCPIANPETLARARRIAETGAGEIELEVTIEPQPLRGDDQVAWTARHIADRLDHTLSLMEASFGLLNDIIHHQHDAQDAISRGSSAARPPTILVMNEDEGSIALQASDLPKARVAVGVLRESLEQWSSEVLRGSTPDAQ